MEMRFCLKRLEKEKWTYIILIEHSKHKWCKFTGITLREKLFVDLDETLECSNCKYESNTSYYKNK